MKLAEEEEQKSEASASEKEDDQTVHNLPLEEDWPDPLLRDVFNTALSHVYQEFKQVSKPFVDHVLLQSVKNTKSRL